MKTQSSQWLTWIIANCLEILTLPCSIRTRWKFRMNKFLIKIQQRRVCNEPGAIPINFVWQKSKTRCFDLQSNLFSTNAQLKMDITGLVSFFRRVLAQTNRRLSQHHIHLIILVRTYTSELTPSLFALSTYSKTVAPGIFQPQRFSCQTVPSQSFPSTIIGISLQPPCNHAWNAML